MTMLHLHSDDFGLKRKVDKKLLLLLKEDKLTGVSVLANLSSSRSLLELSRLQKKNPHIQIGLHINFTAGKSLSDKRYITTLVDRYGKFSSFLSFLFKLLTGKISPEHIAKEINNQLKRLERFGLKISVLDSHQHLHALSPVAEIVANIAQVKKIKFIRNYSAIHTFPLKIKIENLILKFLAYLSFYLSNKKISLPVSWSQQKSSNITIMSWKGNIFDPYVLILYKYI